MECCHVGAFNKIGIRWLDFYVHCNLTPNLIPVFILYRRFPILPNRYKKPAKLNVYAGLFANCGESGISKAA